MNANWIKAGASLFGILLILTGGAVSYGTLMKGQEVTERKVEKIEEKVDKNENVNIEQTVILRQTAKILDELEKRVYK